MSPSKSRSRSEDRRAASLRRHVERELVEGLATRERRSLIERLRGNVEQRRGWDRAVAGFRALEQREVSNFELDQVERWLFEDLDESGLLAEARPEPSRRWTYLAATLATLAAAASLLLWLDEDPAPPTIASITLDTIASNTLQARGDHGWTRPLALELVCGEPARPAAARGCGLDELLGFSLRLGDEEARLHESPDVVQHRARIEPEEFGELLVRARLERAQTQHPQARRRAACSDPRLGVRVGLRVAHIGSLSATD